MMGWTLKGNKEHKSILGTYGEKKGKDGFTKYLQSHKNKFPAIVWAHACGEQKTSTII